VSIDPATDKVVDAVNLATMIDRLTKPQLLEVLEHLQHFRPPRMAKQRKSDLRDCVRRAARSEQYRNTVYLLVKELQQ
jgi:hypothetical protein